MESHPLHFSTDDSVTVGYMGHTIIFHIPCGINFLPKWKPGNVLEEGTTRPLAVMIVFYAIDFISMITGCFGSTKGVDATPICDVFYRFSP